MKDKNKRPSTVIIDTKLNALFVPDRGFSPISTAVGYFLKFLSVISACMGLMLFITDAYGISASLFTLIAVCVISGIVGTLLSFGTLFDFKIRIVSVAAIAVAVGAYIYFGGGFYEAVAVPFLSFYNTAINHISSYNYSGLESFKAFIPSRYIIEIAAERAIYYICAIFSFMFCTGIIVCGSYAPFYIVYACVSFVIFTFNTTKTVYGFALLTSSVIAIGVMQSCEKRYKKAKHPSISHKHSRLILPSRSGGMGFTALVIALIIFAAPVSLVQEQWHEISQINGIMNSVRKFLYETDIPIENPNQPQRTQNFAGGLSSEQSRFAGAYPYEYENTSDMFVYAPTPSNKYLRLWVGDTYSDGEWTSGAGYLTDSDDFMPEDVTELFLTVLGSPSVDELSSDYSFESLGFTVEHIGIHMLYFSDVFVTPSVCSKKYGIKEFDSFEKLNDNKYFNKNGLLVSDEKSTAKNSRYSAVSYVYRRGDDEQNKNLSEAITVFQTILPYLSDYLYSQYDIENRYEDLIRICEKRCRERGVTIPDECIIYRVQNLTDDKKYELATKIDDCLEYSDYVYNKYTKTLSDEAFVERAEKIFKNVDKNAELNPENIELLLSCIDDYYRKNCTYTLSLEPSDENADPVTDFLTNTKKGCCVQYASSAVMLLRYMGVPARYAEGYLASDFEEISLQYPYMADVKDSNAHAWVEYYVDGCGWLTYEATTVYSNSSTSDTSSTTATVPITTTPTDTTAVTTTVGTETTKVPDDTTSGSITSTDESTDVTSVPTSTEDVTDVTDTATSELLFDTTGEDTGAVGSIKSRKTFKIIIICVVSVLFLSSITAVLLVLRKKHGERIADELERALDGESEDCCEFVEKYTVYALRLLKCCSLVRKNSTLPCDFAAECDKALGKRTVTPIIEAYEKLRFGSGVGKDDVAAVATGVMSLRKHVKENVKVKNKLSPIIKGEI